MQPQPFIGTRVPVELTARLDRLATLEQRSRSQKIRMLLERALAEEEKVLGLPPIEEAGTGSNETGHVA
ncbi:ribbon-helix-helix protein, CopG family [Endozoicomonas sp. ALD040]|uniref:ribbon-helix-helix protein, CopG family n=1 Tax=Endozoicomonas sp. ALD040 TaxID=3403079 RepID=UPI003BAFD017